MKIKANVLGVGLTQLRRPLPLSLLSLYSVYNKRQKSPEDYLRL